MKMKALMFCGLALAGSAALAQQPDEQQCRNQVDATLRALDEHTKQTGTEQKLRDLTAAKIREIQKASGSCAALHEINVRRMHS
ncbi:MAG TPA: hypothetical protein VMU33_19255 [Burkholderiaceae bacterium]|nr:hypothetical protein [Burkholderiaceae bacterium]